MTVASDGRSGPDKRVQVVEFGQVTASAPDQTVPTGEVGEVIVSCGSALDYYFGNQEATDKALEGGWY